LKIPFEVQASFQKRAIKLNSETNHFKLLFDSPDVTTIPGSPTSPRMNFESKTTQVNYPPLRIAQAYDPPLRMSSADPPLKVNSIDPPLKMNSTDSIEQQPVRLSADSVVANVVQRTQVKPSLPNQPPPPNVPRPNQPPPPTTPRPAQPGGRPTSPPARPTSPPGRPTSPLPIRPTTQQSVGGTQQRSTFPSQPSTNSTQPSPVVTQQRSTFPLSLPSEPSEPQTRPPPRPAPRNIVVQGISKMPSPTNTQNGIRPPGRPPLPSRPPPISATGRILPNRPLPPKPTGF